MKPRPDARRRAPERDAQRDPSAELGLRDPVRDKARMGDTRYSVTPPRESVRSPRDDGSAPDTCCSCSAQLDPSHAYRIDAEEYVYHFCGSDCYARWRAKTHP
ncbi:MAG: DUF3330 domain-containing protein [Burkholderiales bacterium]|nr:DUF3330 domain-containing protein [Burkholderiales bacterium]